MKGFEMSLDRIQKLRYDPTVNGWFPVQGVGAG
jgi:hypothetical protein